MWSVKTVPNVSSLSLGLGFFAVARLILMGSLISSLLTPHSSLRTHEPRAPCACPWRLIKTTRIRGGADGANEADGSFPSAALEDYGLAVEPEHLTVHVRDLAEAHIVLHRVDEHRHHVSPLAARLGQLLEPPLDLRPVARGLEAPDALELLALDGRVELEIVDGALLRHHVLVDADDDLVPSILHQLIAVRGVRDLPLRIARVDGANDAAHRVDLPDVLVRGLFHLVRQRLEG